MSSDILKVNVKCGYAIPGMILLQVYLYTFSLWRGVAFEALPLSNYAFSPMILPLLGTFLNSCCGIAVSAIIAFFFLISSLS
jgi:hypothetical protein